jgi:DNA-binding YbaB/EbfC family protein
MSESGGPFGDIGKLLEQAQGLSKSMAAAQERLGRVSVVGEAGGGMVKVEVNGRQEVVKIDIEAEILRPEDRQMVQDLLVVAVNQGLERAKGLAAGELGALLHLGR